LQILEAKWFGEQIASFSVEELSPAVNVGSSTLDFRCQRQPHIDRYLFLPIRERGGEVIHVDFKDEPGVDLVGGLMDRNFRSSIATVW